MLHDQDMPRYLWAEACNTAGYFQNQIPHEILGMITLEEVFSGKKSNVSHFRIFGAFIYYHVSKYLRMKLEPTEELGFFVGYAKTPQNY